MSQSKHSIHGLVVDKGTREPISYANVAVIGTSYGTQTDSIGKFSLDNLVPGDYTLQVSYVGYKTEITPQYIITVKNVNITVELEANGNELAEVKVYP